MNTPEFAFGLTESSNVAEFRDVLSDCRRQILLPDDFRVDYRARLQRTGESGIKVAILGAWSSATALHTETPALPDMPRRKTWINIYDQRKEGLLTTEAEAKEMLFPERAHKIEDNYRISQLGELSTQAQLDVADSLRIIEASL